jgi:hypothetical protein
MTVPAEDFARREVGKLLRVDHRGQFLCSSCLKKTVGERFGTAYTRRQIERATDAVFKSPGGLTRMHSFICDRCVNTKPCPGSPRRSAL